MIKRKKYKWDEYIKITKWTFIAALLIFGCIYFLDVVDSPSKLGIVNSENLKEWLNFNVNYLDTIVASFIGLWVLSWRYCYFLLKSYFHYSVPS